MDVNIKNIVFTETNAKKDKLQNNQQQNQKKEFSSPVLINRDVVHTEKWVHSTADEAKDALLLLHNNPTIQGSAPLAIVELLRNQIQQKLYGYRAQDIEKHVWSEIQFISFDKTVEKLIGSNLICYYCKEPVLLLYEIRRDPKQWTLERIDNKYGHWTDNIEIACLACNIRRRVMQTERYMMTKQIMRYPVIKMD